MHFENLADREAYIQTNDTLERYEILSWSKINNDLYSLTLILSTRLFPQKLFSNEQKRRTKESRSL